MANLSEAVGLRKLCIEHEVLKPGHRSSPAHSHSHKEEFIYVLRGSVRVWIDGHWQTASAGTTMGFPPEVAHMVVNDTADDAELLIVSTPRDDQDNITYVPDDEIV